MLWAMAAMTAMGCMADELPTFTPNRILAFPGAQGVACNTVGGAGGKVIHVTRLDDAEEPGTLRWAVRQKGARTVVFDVAGVIALKSTLKISNDSITIAGQTAPAPGICLKGYTLNIQASEVIIRYIRCRMGDEEGREDDSMNSFYNKEGHSGWKNILVDHCSLSWSTDECGSFYGSENLTVQWCILSESLANSIHSKKAHGYGGLWGGCPATFHHNLLAHHTNRTPRLCGSRYSNLEADEKVDVVNNVYYNFGSEGAYAGQGGSYNLLYNYYKPGPYTVTRKAHCRFFTPYPDDGTNHQAEGICGKFWLQGNYMDSRDDLSKSQMAEAHMANIDNFSPLVFSPKTVKKQDGTTIERPQADFRATSAFPNDPNGYSYVESAEDAYKNVLLFAGASNHRDKIDTRIVKETTDGTFTYRGSHGSTGGIIDSQKDVEGYAEYVETKSDIVDTDGDGMPDSWETKRGLNPNDPTDGAHYNLSEHYTNLEVYLNTLVANTFPLHCGSRILK